jgi:hypothetical protein
MAKPDVIVVTGTDRLGKSALALALAEARGGTVINADAMQTYDAFPDPDGAADAEERARAPHALYGVLPLSETCRRARWRDLRRAEIDALQGCPSCAAARALPARADAGHFRHSRSCPPSSATGQCRVGGDGRRRLPRALAETRSRRSWRG